MKQIADMAAAFAQALPAERASYGANIMLVAAPDLTLPVRFPKALTDRLRFHDSQSVAGLRAILYLYLPPELLVQSLDGELPKQVPVIALPIPQEVTVRGYDMTLPGAPRALVTGQPNAYGDTRRLASDHCSAFSKPLVEEIEEYFSENGEGSDMRSFASYRIGASGNKPVGVLNIDAKREDLLGASAAHPTFYALLVPVLLLLAWPVAEYARLRSETGTLYGELPDGTRVAAVELS